MPLTGTEKYKNRVAVSCTITGTGAYGTFTALPTYDAAGIAAFADGDVIVAAVWPVDAYGNPTSTNWEVGRYTVGSSGTTLTRTEILAGSNGTSAVNWPASSNVRIANVRPGERDRFPILTLYTADGTHTFNANTRFWWAMAIGGGGGGGTGRKGANVSTRGGGGGGGGGGVSVHGPIPYTHGAFAPTVDILIGLGGVSGGSATANDQNGSPGTAGQSTFVGGLTAGGGTPGGGGTAGGGGSAGTGGTGNLFNGRYGRLGQWSGRGRRGRRHQRRQHPGSGRGRRHSIHPLRRGRGGSIRSRGRHSGGGRRRCHRVLRRRGRGWRRGRPTAGGSPGRERGQRRVPGRRGRRGRGRDQQQQQFQRGRGRGQRHGRDPRMGVR